jgi:hypothetical protein
MLSLSKHPALLGGFFASLRMTKVVDALPQGDEGM